MTTVPVSRPSSPRNAMLAAILLAGTLVAIFDGSFAVIFWGLRGVKASTIFQSVASGLLGRNAFQGGVPTVLLGLCIHMLVAFSAAAVYQLVYQRSVGLPRRPWLNGPIYGIAVYVFMNYLVIPLSHQHSGPFRMDVAIPALLVHVFLIGLPIALVTHYFHQRDTRLA